MKYLYPIVIAPASILIPIAAAIVKYSALKKDLKIVLYYLIISGGINLLAVILAANSIHNLYLLHIYTIVEFAILLLFFREVFTGRRVSRIIIISIAVFTVLCIVNFIFLQSINKYNTYTRPLEGIFMIGFSLAYFEKESRIDKAADWASYPLNWIITGTLLYFSGALFLFAFSNVVSIKLAHNIKIELWNIHTTFVIIMYLLFAIGFSKCKR